MLRFPYVYRPWRILFPKVIYADETYPRFYGVAFAGTDDYLDEDNKLQVVQYKCCYPIPFNWFVAIWVRTAIFLKIGTPYEWFYMQWNNAYEEGRASVKDEQLHTEL